MGKILGFRRNKVPYHKTPLKDVVAIYDKDPKKYKDAKRALYQVRRYDQTGMPSELYKPTAWRTLVIYCKWRKHKASAFFKSAWQRMTEGSNDVSNKSKLR